jgi:nitronate monooxygenase
LLLPQLQPFADLNDRLNHGISSRPSAARGMENRWTREMREHAPFPLQSWLMGSLKRATAGRIDLSSLWSGQITPNLKHRTVSALMKALDREIHA